VVEISQFLGSTIEHRYCGEKTWSKGDGFWKSSHQSERYNL